MSCPSADNTQPNGDIKTYNPPQLGLSSNSQSVNPTTTPSPTHPSPSPLLQSSNNQPANHTSIHPIPSIPNQQPQPHAHNGQPHVRVLEISRHAPPVLLWPTDLRNRILYHVQRQSGRMASASASPSGRTGQDRLKREKMR